MDSRRVCLGCRAYSRAAVEALNPAYILAHERSMCMGDPFCEMAVTPRRRGRRGRIQTGRA
jgi:hypothetical protein